MLRVTSSVNGSGSGDRDASSVLGSGTGTQVVSLSATDEDAGYNRANPAMTEAEVRTAIVTALGSLSDAAESAIQKELAKTFDLGQSGRLQFEIDPFTC